MTEPPPRKILQREGDRLHWTCEYCKTECQCPVGAVVASCANPDCLSPGWWIERTVIPVDESEFPF